MGTIDGFLTIEREDAPKRKVEERVKDFKEIYTEYTDAQAARQARRCMDCGVPFCHQGCPLGNLIPDFNDAVAQEDWPKAAELLLATNNFPEFTGRICPAPCEASCVLSINKPAVTIEHIERKIAETAFEKGWIQAEKPERLTGKKVAIVGSGPAGLAAAAQLRKAGHEVEIFERDDRPGGLLRYGIPDFKLEKWVIDRRIALLKQAGIRFHLQVHIGRDISIRRLRRNFDAVLLAIGASKPRALEIPGHHLKGIHPAMDYLTLQNRKTAGDPVATRDNIDAAGKHVLVIGGGDTGSDCVGTATRQGAKSIIQLQYRPAPPGQRMPDNPWPEWPLVLTESISHEEGCERSFNVLTKEFVADSTGQVIGLKVVELEWKNPSEYFEKPGTEQMLPCTLALVAIGYEGPALDTLSKTTRFETDKKGNVWAREWQTSEPGVFVAGDAYRGQSLVVWAIADGREAAHAIDSYLMGSSDLPRKEVSLFHTQA
jgi:glutamate synthase (NADPH) small chain